MNHEVSKAVYWDDIYREQITPRWDLGQTAPPLAAWLASGRLGPCRVLVPGCGFGHDAIALARAGFDVVAVDFAPLAIAGAQERAQAAGLRRNLTFVQADVFDLPRENAAAFDAIYEYTCFVAIEHARRDAFARAMHTLLKPGGLLFGCFYNHGRPGGPPFDTTREDVERHFRPLFTFERLEVSPHSIARRAGHELWAELRKL